jgi:hypothetical protein
MKAPPLLPFLSLMRSHGPVVSFLDSRLIHRGGARQGAIAFAAFGQVAADYSITGPVLLPPWARKPTARKCGTCGSTEDVQACIQCEREWLCADHQMELCLGCRQSATQSAGPVGEPTMHIPFFVGQLDGGGAPPPPPSLSSRTTNY